MKMKSDTFYKIINAVGALVEGIILHFLKAYLNTVAGQGFFSRIINKLVDEGYEHLLDPFVERAIVKAGYLYDKSTGKVLIKKLEEATNAEDYNSTADDILGRV